MLKRKLIKNNPLSSENNLNYIAKGYSVIWSQSILTYKKN